MTDRGRNLLLLNIGFVLAGTIAMIAVHIFAESQDDSFRLSAWWYPVRFILTAGLCIWLYRGSRVARWIVIVVLGAAGLLGLVNFFSGSFAAFVMAISSMAYLSLAVVSGGVGQVVEKG